MVVLRGKFMVLTTPGRSLSFDLTIAIIGEVAGVRSLCRHSLVVACLNNGTLVGATQRVHSGWSHVLSLYRVVRSLGRIGVDRTEADPRNFGDGFDRLGLKKDFSPDNSWLIGVGVHVHRRMVWR